MTMSFYPDDLRDGPQQLLHTTEAVCLGLQCFSHMLGIGRGKFMKEKLLVVVSMEQKTERSWQTNTDL